MDTPILLLFFNRSKNVKQLINRLKITKPKKIFISLDGPRKNNSKDLIEIRKILEIITSINWNCEVTKNINSVNLGCKVSVTNAINWFFSKNEYGIILEDDCIPGNDFFNFCEYNLKKYKNNDKIMQISGNNFLLNDKLCETSYYYSTINDIWGWATWKRAWDHYKIDISDYNYKKDYKMLLNYYKNKSIVKWMKKYFDNSIRKENDIWSTQWTYAMIKADGITIVPKVNLVKNIGFDRSGTTKDNFSFKIYSEIEAKQLKVIKDPKNIKVNYYLDKIRFRLIKKTDPNLFLYNNFIKLIPKPIKKIIKYIKVFIKH